MEIPLINDHVSTEVTDGLTKTTSTTFFLKEEK